MCGIVGVLTAPQGELWQGHWQAALRRMMAALRHRGPDGEGAFCDRGAGQHLYLGHRRLDVFAPGPLGSQPMQGPGASRRYTLCFNGAIYNFVELARELEITGDTARSDTAVLLYAWAAWGPQCLSRLNGMFAFAMWDAVERTLYLCRDRFGEKPLQYAPLAGTGDGSRLIFASEARALFASRLLRPSVDRDQLAEFLASHDIDHRGNLEGTTLFAEVRQVPAGCYLRIRPEQPLAEALRPIRYYMLAPPTRRRPLDRALVAEARELFSDAVRLRLRSDVPLGGSLSGGLDSSLLSALAARLRPPFAERPFWIFTCQFPEAHDPPDETAWAERVIKGLALHPVVRVTPSSADFAADLEDVLFHQEAPFADASVCSHFALMRAVRERGVTVLLSGQGGDEVFAGYPSFYNTLLGGLLRAGQVASLWQQAQARSRRTGEPVLRLLTGAAYHALPGPLRQHLYTRRRRGSYPLSLAGERRLAAAPRRFDGPLPPLCKPPADRWSLFDVYLLDCMARWALPHILRQDDRNSMAFAVESRAPYLDHRLLELLLSVDPTVRIGDGYTKRLLREVAAGLLPESVRLRVDKLGFFSPQLFWLRDSEERVRAACRRLPAELIELTDVQRLDRSLDAFYRHGRRELSGVVWTAFVCSVFLSRVVPRLADMGI